MKTPNVIYLQTCTDCGCIDCENCKFEYLELEAVTWSQDKINANDTTYYGEEAVIEILREEYEQANQLIDYASHLRTPTEGGLIDIDKSVREALKRLKGGKR